MSAKSSFRIRLWERVVWTAVQAGLAVVTVEMFNVPAVYAPLIAAGLSWLKGQVARRIGDPYDPATLPAGV
jgi:hypothetical protein